MVWSDLLATHSAGEETDLSCFRYSVSSRLEENIGDFGGWAKRIIHLFSLMDTPISHEVLKDVLWSPDSLIARLNRTYLNEIWLEIRCVEWIYNLQIIGQELVDTMHDFVSTTNKALLDLIDFEGLKINGEACKTVKDFCTQVLKLLLGEDDIQEGETEPIVPEKTLGEGWGDWEPNTWNSPDEWDTSKNTTVELNDFEAGVFDYMKTEYTSSGKSTFTIREISDAEGESISTIESCLRWIIEKQWDGKVLWGKIKRVEQGETVNYEFSLFEASWDNKWVGDKSPSKGKWGDHGAAEDTEPFIGAMLQLEDGELQRLWKYDHVDVDEFKIDWEFLMPDNFIFYALVFLAHVDETVNYSLNSITAKSKKDGIEITEGQIMDIWKETNRALQNCGIDIKLNKWRFSLYQEWYESVGTTQDEVEPDVVEETPVVVEPAVKETPPEWAEAAEEPTQEAPVEPEVTKWWTRVTADPEPRVVAAVRAPARITTPEKKPLLDSPEEETEDDWDEPEEIRWVQGGSSKWRKKVALKARDPSEATSFDDIISWINWNDNE